MSHITVIIDLGKSSVPGAGGLSGDCWVRSKRPRCKLSVQASWSRENLKGSEKGM